MPNKALKITTPGDRELVMTRDFDAPRELVWEAITTPALVKRWLGVQNRWTLDVCDIDLRVGGRYRYVWRGPAGEEMGMGGTYTEVTPPARLVATEKFDHAWYPGDASSSIDLTEANGVTTLTQTVRYASKEARDGVIKGPATTGVEGSYQSLDALLASILRTKGA